MQEAIGKPKCLHILVEEATALLDARDAFDEQPAANRLWFVTGDKIFRQLLKALKAIFRPLLKPSRGSDVNSSIHWRVEESCLEICGFKRQTTARGDSGDQTDRSWSSGRGKCLVVVPAFNHHVAFDNHTWFPAFLRKVLRHNFLIADVFILVNEGGWDRNVAWWGFD